ncbi:hypothetical protein CROQUDRAFT_723001 [Cronartium quercuum f. sp. fusiforme G11]|uniref:Uncharacterized protein n=1 Tax=Cronartium quercuum f. sp. fusiforme G11 TaxID=708437 RepID=A0A9P6TBF2_9BASI|nr:hypothetical protein CROQUDRAFT_723001 [Cronartium quercuum f. sp. fusiforme G11]
MKQPVVQKCIAYNRLKKPCPNDREPDSKWCSLHEELQGKFLRMYKHHSRELDKFSIENPYPLHQECSSAVHQSNMPPNLTPDEILQPIITNSMIPRDEDVKKIDDVGILRVWHQIARRTWALANRTVIAREHHHSQFYQNGDDGHRHFNAILKHKQDVLESLMSAIDEKLYKLTLESEKARWLLPQLLEEDCADSASDDSSSDGPVFTDIECEDEIQSIESLSIPLSSPSLEFEEVDDFQKQIDDRSRAVVSQLTGHLDFPIFSSQMDESTVVEIKEIVRNVFRRIIVRDAGLFVRAKELDPSPSLDHTITNREQVWRQVHYVCPIKSFIMSGKLSLKELQRMWRMLKFGKDKIGPELIRNAIYDVFRSQNDDEDFNPTNSKKSCKIWVLGGYVWRKAMNGPLPRLATDYLHAFVGCSGCMLSICRTFDEWVENRRLALIGSRYSGWLDPVKLPIENLFRSLRIAISRHNSTVKLSKVEKVVPKCKALKMVYTEVQERHYIHLCLVPLNDRSRNIIDALASNKASYNVFAQRRDTGEITHTPHKRTDLWCTRVRSAYSTVERRKKLFTPSTMFRPDPSLFQCALKSPEQIFNRNFDDCWDLLVMDAKVLGFESFLESIGKILVEVVRCTSKDEKVYHAFDDSNLSDEVDINNKLLTVDTRYLRIMFREPVHEKIDG